MNRRIVSFLMTLLSYVAVYRLFRYLSDRVFGKDNQAGYKRIAATFATLVLTPRFRYNNDEEEDAIEMRWPLLRTYRKLFSFPKKKKRKKGSDLEGKEENETLDVTGEAKNGETTESPEPRPEASGNGNASVNGENTDSAPLSDT